jgi:hypothetical protein
MLALVPLDWFTTQRQKSKNNNDNPTPLALSFSDAGGFLMEDNRFRTYPLGWRKGGV